jgi:hypothetical protein
MLKQIEIKDEKVLLEGMGQALAAMLSNLTSNHEIALASVSPENQARVAAVSALLVQLCARSDRSEVSVYEGKSNVPFAVTDVTGALDMYAKDDETRRLTRERLLRDGRACVLHQGKRYSLRCT